MNYLIQLDLTERILWQQARLCYITERELPQGSVELQLSPDMAERHLQELQGFLSRERYTMLRHGYSILIGKLEEALHGG